jgi:hypothetical protein
MKRRALVTLVVLLIGLGTASSQTNKPSKTDAEIKQEMISASIASYPGTCPCPYSRDRRGRSCGARSAYSRPGGRSPLSYADDVTQKMVDEHRRTTKQ